MDRRIWRTSSIFALSSIVFNDLERYGVELKLVMVGCDDVELFREKAANSGWEELLLLFEEAKEDRLWGCFNGEEGAEKSVSSFVFSRCFFGWEIAVLTIGEGRFVLISRGGRLSAAAVIAAKPELFIRIVHRSEQI